MLKILIVDDEAPARDRLRRLLTDTSDHELDLADAVDGVDALEQLQGGGFDLAFLDVRMPGLDGFEVLDRLSDRDRPAIVFTTAYDEYALRAFDAHAIDYLLKPVEPERLAVALDRAVPDTATAQPDDRLARLLDYIDDAATRDPSAQSSEPPLQHFTVSARDRLIVVTADDIVAAEVTDGITNLFVAGETGLARHIVSFTLDALEARLDPSRFMRVHRSALVRLDAIREMIPWFSGRYKLALTGGHEVVASRARSRELKDRLAL